MATRSMRFTVADERGNRGASWKIWIHTETGKNDVYLACRELGGALKASLHESGSWHVGFIRKFVLENLATNEPKRADPYIEIWPRPAAIQRGITLAYRIIVPTAALNIRLDQRIKSSMIVVPAAPTGKATEITVFLLSPGALCSNWPGRRSMGTNPVSCLELDNSEKVWVVCHIVDVPQLESKAGRLSPFKSRRPTKSPAGILRGLVFGSHDDGSRWIMECAMTGESEQILHSLADKREDQSQTYCES